MSTVSVQKNIERAAVLVLVAAYLWFLKPLFFVDFWYDEVMSLEEFILVPFKKTVTDYPVPNNHIFFSVLMNGWLKLWGINTFAQAVQNVFIVRLLPALFGVGALLAVKSAADKLTRQQGGIVAMVALMCMLPFHNYVTQVRGYGLSIFLAALLTNSIVALLVNGSRKAVWGILACSALFIYTIPSNLYAVAALLVVAFVSFAIKINTRGLKTALATNAAKGFAFAIAGVLLAIVLYLPVLKQVLNNDYVKSNGLFRWGMWKEAAVIMGYLFKPYYLLLILLCAGLGVGFYKKAEIRSIGILGAIILLPFVFSFIRGDKPFDRVFLWICPLLAVMAGVAFNILYDKVIRGGVLERSFRFLVLIATIWSLQDAKKQAEARLAVDLTNEVNRCDIYYNNLLTNYHTNQNLEWFKQQHYADSIPVYLHEVDKYAMHGYLPLYGIKWEPDPQKIKSVDRYFIITLAPEKAQDHYLQFDSSYTFKRLNPDLDYVNIVEAIRIEKQ